MKVRRLGPGDEDTLATAVSDFRGLAAIDPAAFLADPSTFIFVARDDTGTVGWVYGYVLNRPEGRRAMFIYELEVAERVRRQGHGSRLIEACLAEARRLDCFKVWVLTETENSAARGLYLATGAAPGIDQAMLIWES